MLKIEPARFRVGETSYELTPATIERTMLGYEDHGIFTFMLTLDYSDGGTQGAGMMCLDEPVKDADGKHLGREGTGYGHDAIIHVLKTVGVSEWEQLKGKSVYAIREDGYGYVRGIASMKSPSTNYFIFEDHATAWKNKQS